MKERRKVRFSHKNNGYGFDDAFKEFCRINYLRNKRCRIFRPERVKYDMYNRPEKPLYKSFFEGIFRRGMKRITSRARNKHARIARRITRANA